MKTLDVINGIIEYIKSSGVTMPAFAYEKPKKQSGDYIVVNGMPAVYLEEICTQVFNINVHCKDNIAGTPKTDAAFEAAEQIKAIFDQSVEIAGTDCNLYSFGGMYQDTDSTHYVNIQVEAHFTNLNFLN